MTHQTNLPIHCLGIVCQNDQIGIVTVSLSHKNQQQDRLMFLLSVVQLALVPALPSPQRYLYCLEVS